jgi:nucleosome binding factor SPN SPT16 subunit
MESEAKRKRDKEFETFCNKVRELSGGDVDFERPIEELKFQGSVGRAMVILKPTRTCLVQLIDWVSTIRRVFRLCILMLSILALFPCYSERSRLGAF